MTIIAVLFTFTLPLKASETINLTCSEVENVVSQKLAVAQMTNDASALQEAFNAINGRVRDNAVIYLKYTEADILPLRLKLLETAYIMLKRNYCGDALNDKGRVVDAIKLLTEDEREMMHDGIAGAINPKAGLFGRVPWPEKIPSEFEGRKLWHPGQSPEKYKDSDPQLYAYYKPLYDENLRQTDRYDKGKTIKRIFWNNLEAIRSLLSGENLNSQKTAQKISFDALAEVTIKDDSLRKFIFSEVHSVHSNK